jgi:hypothetical protein
VSGLACPATGDCTVAGYFVAANGSSQAFLATETNGVWGNAQQLANTGFLSANGASSFVTALSCHSVGNCVVGGSYSDSNGAFQAFVATASNGVWTNAAVLPGATALNVGATTSNLGAGVSSIDCSTAEDCVAAGSYMDPNGVEQSFVATETNDLWQNAVEVPGTASLNAGGTTSNNGSYTSQLACPTTGSCSLVGSYTDVSGVQQAYETNQNNGSWQNAVAIPGLLTLGSGAPAGVDVEVDQMSCPSAGNCAVGGVYTDASGNGQAFVENEVSGAWGVAQEVPGTASLNVGGLALVVTVSCFSAGNCAAGGFISETNSTAQAFVVNEVAGTWGTMEIVPSLSQYNNGGYAGVTSMACVANNQCLAGGFYSPSSTTYQSFTTMEASAPPSPDVMYVRGVAKGQISVGWPPSPLDGWSTTTGYQVTASPGGATCTSTANPFCDVVGLNTKTAYTFTAQAINAVGASVASAPSYPEYADSTVGYVLVPLSSHVTKGKKFKVLVSGQGLRAKVTVTLAKSGAGSCVPVPQSDQCVVTLVAKAKGALKLRLFTSRTVAVAKSWTVSVH